jgi:hypothetical protein
MPNDFITRHLAEQPDAIAPDGSEVRLLAATQRGSMAQFSLPAGSVSIAVCHRTIEELWYFTSGSGKLWRKSKTPRKRLTFTPACRFQFQLEPISSFAAIAPNPCRPPALPCHHGRERMKPLW